MSTIRCISLWQPWAQLIVCGAKRFETRSWSTNHRGPIAIHAAKRFQKHEREWAAMLHRRGFLDVTESDMPLGAIVAVARLVEVWPSDHPALDALTTGYEKSFGNFDPGRFAWELQGVVKLDEPVPFRGRQQLFDVPAAIVSDVLGVPA